MVYFWRRNTELTEKLAYVLTLVSYCSDKYNKRKKRPKGHTYTFTFYIIHFVHLNDFCSVMLFVCLIILDLIFSCVIIEFFLLRSSSMWIDFLDSFSYCVIKGFLDWLHFWFTKLVIHTQLLHLVPYLLQLRLTTSIPPTPAPTDLIW